MPEPLSPDAYALAGGVHCPLCHKTEVEMEMDLSASDFRTVIQVCVCLVCGADWEAIYALTGYQALTPGEKEPQ